MNFNNTLKSLSIVAIAIAPNLMGFTYLPYAAQEQVSPRQIGQIRFPPTGNRDVPQSTVGGGNRSENTACISTPAGEPPLVAMMPNRENTAKMATATPNLYVYLGQTTAETGELVVTDGEDNEIYFAEFDLPSQPGIVKIGIPRGASLKSGNTYKWSFMVVCHPQYRNRDRVVEGTMEYVELSADDQSKLAKATTATDKAKIYANSTIWYETLDTVAQLRQENLTDWQELLKSVGLEMFVDKPLVDCCRAK